jgi:hypothetical protein
MLCPFRISVFLSPTFYGRAARFLIAVLFCIGILPTPVLAQPPTQRQLRIAADNLARSLSSLSEAFNKTSEAAKDGKNSEAIAFQKVLSERRQTVNLVHALAGKLNQAKLGVRGGGSASGNDAAKVSAQNASLVSCEPSCKISKAQLDVVRAAVSELAKKSVKEELEALLAELQAAAAAAAFIPFVGQVLAAILAAVAAMIAMLQQLEAKALEDQADAKERVPGLEKERKRIGADKARKNDANISRGANTSSGSKTSKDTVTAIPCGTPANPCNPGSSKSMLKGGLLDADSGFSSNTPSAAGSPANARPTGRGPR